MNQIRPHEYVAEQIHRHITLRLTGPWRRLALRARARQAVGVGRPTIQMSLRVLHNQRLFETRLGRNGGTFILAHTEGEEARYELKARMLRGPGEIEALLVFRQMVESAIVEVVARAGRQTDLKALRAAVTKLDAANGRL